MDIEFFKQIVKKRKIEKPILFELEHDRILNEDEVTSYEKINNINIPEKYKQFLLQYGGGYFGFAAMYSLDSASGHFIFNNMEDVPTGYIPISDNGCGDLFLLKSQSNTCQEKVYFLNHETKEIIQTKYSDVFEYLVQEGLSISL